MSPQELSTNKRSTDIYTVMLFIAALALIVGCALLYAEWSSYSSTKPTGTSSWSPPAGQAQLDAPVWA